MFVLVDVYLDDIVTNDKPKILTKLVIQKLTGTHTNHQHNGQIRDEKNFDII